MPAEPRLHVIGNAHIDPVWIWDWREGMHEVLQTFRAALERLGSHPGLVFTASSAAYYQWVEEVDPELFAGVRAAVQAGRWIPAGGQWVEPDCNIPSGESVCRQFLYGQRHLAERLGRAALVGWNVDSFGHAGTLPQLLARSGLRAYVMMRPGEEELDLPSPLFVWEGPDGTRLPTYRVPFDYSTRDGAEDEVITSRAAALLERSAAFELPLMLFVGIGDHGGGPTRLALRTVDQLAAEHGGALAFSDPESYFAAVAGPATPAAGSPGTAPAGQGTAPAGDRHLAPQAVLPLVAGELQHHAVGCYSAHPRVKQGNARAERALVEAETLAELCRAVTGLDHAVAPALGEAWRGVLFAQFHDSLGGTCTEAAYQAIEDLQSQASAVADRVTTRAAHAIAQQIDTWTAGAEEAEGMESAISGLPVPMVVFNPLSRPVRKLVSIPHPVAAASDSEGSPVPVQQLASGEVTYSPTRAALIAEVPALGWRRYWLHAFEPERDPGAAPPETAGAAESAGATQTAGAIELTSGDLSCRVDATTGAVSELRAHGERWLGAGGILPVVVPDASDTWSHGVDRYSGEELLPALHAVAISEPGPVRATARLTFCWGGSTVVEEVSLYAGGGFVEVRLDVDWHDSLHLLKLVVPAALAAGGSAAGAPYGHVEREPSGIEEVMSHWVAASGELAGGGTGTLGCTADCTYGYDLLGSRLRLTVLRSPRFADHGMGWGDAGLAAYPATAQGRHRLGFRLHALPGDLDAGAMADRAAEHCVELPLVLDSWHRGPLGPLGSGFSVEGASVRLGALKRAEDRAGTVARAWETAGRASTARLELPFHGRAHVDEWRPQEVKTLYLPDDTALPVREVDIPELRPGPR